MLGHNIFEAHSNNKITVLMMALQTYGKQKTLLTD